MIPPDKPVPRGSSPRLLTAFRRLLLPVFQRSFSAVEEERDPPCDFRHRALVGFVLDLGGCSSRGLALDRLNF